ncbi:MAG: hypothetical protein FWB93_01170 [Oscillospiraceae bacterium]|nr:hypothetical protein [Oscillospiraceae bacterium]
MTDTVLKNEGIRVLTQNLGKVEAERFISLIIREPFDYTAWRKNLFDDMSIEELSAKATEFAENEK